MLTRVYRVWNCSKLAHHQLATLLYKRQTQTAIKKSDMIQLNLTNRYKYCWLLCKAWMSCPNWYCMFFQKMWPFFESKTWLFAANTNARGTWYVSQSFQHLREFNFSFVFIRDEKCSSLKEMFLFNVNLSKGNTQNTSILHCNINSSGHGVWTHEQWTLK